MTSEFRTIATDEPGLRLEDSGIPHTAGIKEALRERVTSRPPSGSYRVYNIYLNKVGENYLIVMDHEDVPEP